MRRLSGRYAQYYNARSGRIGHLWQNRFFSCLLAPDRLWTALAYVERNPLRARIVRRCEDYLWSSAIAHLTDGDGSHLLDMEWWRKNRRANWREAINQPLPKTEDGAASSDPQVRLRQCTYAGRPFGDECFVDEMSMRFQRHWSSGRGRPSKKSLLRPHEKAAQIPLFRPPDS
jgi:putative transposase